TAKARAPATIRTRGWSDFDAAGNDRNDRHLGLRGRDPADAAAGRGGPARLAVGLAVVVGARAAGRRAARRGRQSQFLSDRSTGNRLAALGAAAARAGDARTLAAAARVGVGRSRAVHR